MEALGIAMDSVDIHESCLSRLFCTTNAIRKTDTISNQRITQHTHIFSMQHQDNILAHVAHTAEAQKNTASCARGTQQNS